MNENVKEIMENVATDVLTEDVVEDVIVNSGIGVGKKIAIGGVVIVAGYGIYKGVKWLINKNNKKNVCGEVDEVVEEDFETE